MLKSKAALAPMLCMGALAIAAPSAAQPFSEIHADVVKPVSATGGLIFSDGTVFIGDHYTVKHVSKGVYKVTFSKGLFALWPIFSCTAYGSITSPPVCLDSLTNWPGPTAAASTTFSFFSSATGEPVDTEFQFTAVAAQNVVEH